MIFCEPILFDFLAKRFSVSISQIFTVQKQSFVIELDGSGHYTEEGKQYDEERTAFLEEYGLTVIRIPDTEIHKNFRSVCEYIDRLVEQSLSQLR